MSGDDDDSWRMNLMNNDSNSLDTQIAWAGHLNHRIQAIAAGVPLNCSPVRENDIHYPVHRH